MLKNRSAMRNDYLCFLMSSTSAGVLILAAVVKGQAATAPASTQRWDDVQNTLARQIDQILDIKQGREDLIPLIKAAAAGVANGDLSATVEQIDVIAEKVATGQIDLQRYTDSIMDATHIQIDSPRSTVSGVETGQRLRLNQLIWSQAEKSVANDPQKASRLAKTALALAVAERTEIRWGFLRPYLDIWFDRFKMIAGLNDVQARQLEAIAGKLREYREKMSVPVTPALRSTDKLIELPKDQAVTPAMIDDSLARLTAWKASSDGDLESTYEVLWEANILKNIGRVRNEHALTNAIDKFLSDWQATSGDSDKITRRWLNEARSSEANPPLTPRVIDLRPGDPRYENFRKMMQMQQK